MKHPGHIVIVLAAAMAMTSACRTQSYAPGADADTWELKIRAGDEIRIVTTRRERLTFEVTEVRSDCFVGMTAEPHKKERRPAGETVEVPYDDLALLEVTRFDKHSAALVAALVTVSAFAVIAAPVTVVPLLPPP